LVRVEKISCIQNERNHFSIENKLIIQLNISLCCDEPLLDIAVNKHMAKKNN